MRKIICDQCGEEIQHAHVACAIGDAITVTLKSDRRDFCDEDCLRDFLNSNQVPSDAENTAGFEIDETAQTPSEPCAQYWIESGEGCTQDGQPTGTFNFSFGRPDDVNNVIVHRDDMIEARKWLVAAAPTMLALDGYHQARSFADKWAADKRKHQPMPEPEGGA